MTLAYPLQLELSRSVFCVFLSVLPFSHLPQSLFCLVISSTPFTCAHLSSAVPCHQSLSPQYLVSLFVHSICQIFTVTDLVYSCSTQVLVFHVKSRSISFSPPASSRDRKIDKKTQNIDRDKMQIVTAES